MRADILQSLATNDRAVRRALILLYHRQTADEQATSTTAHKNGQGFNAGDALALSAMAKDLLIGASLSLADYAEARRRLPKYVGQLEEFAIQKTLHKLMRENNGR